MKQVTLYRAIFFFMTLILLGNAAKAQEPSEKALKKHREKVEKSKLKGKVVVSLDTIFSAGEPYAILRKRKKMLSLDYGVYALNGEELIDVQLNCESLPPQCVHTFLFLESGVTAEVSLGISQGIEDILIENALIANNQVDAKSERRFVLKNPPQISGRSSLPITVDIGTSNGSVEEPRTSRGRYELVKRNKTAKVWVKHPEIEQDFKVIGSYEERRDDFKDSYTLYLINGTPVAEAQQVEMNSETYSVLTLKDHRKHLVKVEMRNRAVEYIANYLIEYGYL